MVAIFALILGFRVANPSYIPFLFGLKICHKLVPKSTLSDKNWAKRGLKMIKKMATVNAPNIWAVKMSGC